MTIPTVVALPTITKPPRRRVMVSALGITQIIAWGSTYYLLAVLAKPIADDTGWSLAWVVGGLSLGLLTAGLVSPKVGDSIQYYGGRPVLALSAVFMALGLAGLALAPTLPVYIAAWLVLGLGMGAGLYDAAFATLGRLYGQKARAAITTLTLFGGFASTASWPVSAALVSEVGWRGACLVYAGVHLAILLPLYIFVLPNEPKREKVVPAAAKGEGAAAAAANAKSIGLLFGLVALTITISSMISALLSVHLLTILQAKDISFAAAVALGTMVGPSQVGARAIEMAISRYHHPIWTKIASTIFVAVGVGSLWAGLPIISMALIFYGAGIGLESIVRGTLPLALFGEQRYAAIMGRIAMPSLIVQAATPSLGAILIEHFGAKGTLGTLFVIAVGNFLLVLILSALIAKRNQSTDRT